MTFNKPSDLVSRLILRLGGERFSPFIRIYRVWKNVVGDMLAERSHPFRYKNEILYVAVNNNTWMQELVLRKQEIASKCAKASGETIQDIIFLIQT